MGTKGVPFGYLEFSHTIGRKSCPHMRAAVAAAASQPVPGSGSGPGLDSGSLPGLVLFELGLTILITYKSEVENQLNKNIKILKSDRGGEYESNDFSELCAKFGIIHQTIAPYTPQ